MNAKRCVGLVALCLAMILGFLGFIPATAAAAASLLAGAHAAAIVGDTVSTSDLTSAMKVIFGDSLINNVVKDSELIDLFQEGGGIKTDITTGGRYIETAQLFGLPAGVGSRGETGYIPVPRGPRMANSRITLKKIMGSVEIYGDVLKRVRTDIGAFVDWGAQAMPKLVERLVSELDRIMLNTGSGIKARVNDVSPALTLVVDDAMGVAGYGGALFQFLAGETIVASSAADGSGLRTTPKAMVVEDIDYDNEALIIAASPGLAGSLANNDYLAEGDEADNSFDKEAMGLLGIVDDGNVLQTFQNIDRNSYLGWRAQVIDADADVGTGTTFTEEVVVYADTRVYQRGGGKPNRLVTSRDAHTALWKDMKGDRTFNDPGGNYGGGKGQLAIQLGDRMVPVRVARKMPPALAFLLSTDTLHKWLLREFEWDDTTGSLFRQVTDSTGRKDAFYAYGTMHFENGCDDPQKNARIENFQV